MARLLALDVGAVRIGVAVSDATGFLASPYTTLHVSRDEQHIWQAIQKLIDETGSEGVVVGLPISMDGQIHAQGQLIQSFAERLRSHISVPLVYWDERLSTVEAQRLLGERNLVEGRKRQRRSGPRHSQKRRHQQEQEIDAMAAAVILQDYLDQKSIGHSS